MRKTFVTLLCVAFALSSQEVQAWGGWAHKFITCTADRYLEPEVKAKVEKYLGSPMIDHCIWMDQIRRPIQRKSHPDYAQMQVYRPSLRWHHMVVDEKFKVSDKRSKKGAGAMIPNLEKCIENLRDYRNLTDSAVAVNLKYVIHMMQDMHCPSHIFYTEFEDCFSGVVNGKKVRRHDQITVYYNGKKTTSHRVWDGLSIRQIWPEYGADYEKFRVALDVVKPKKRAKMCEGTIEEWVLQNAKDIRYIYEDITPGCQLDREYLLKNQKLSKQQCLRASYRLAHILNECFK